MSSGRDYASFAGLMTHGLNRVQTLVSWGGQLWLVVHGAMVNYGAASLRDLWGVGGLEAFLICNAL